jgi:hypothetical protein
MIGGVGYRGKQAEQARARELRAESWTLTAIAAELGVSKSSVSVWVRDVPFVPRPRNRGASTQRPHPLAVAKQAEVAAFAAAGTAAIGQLSGRDLLVAGVALYAGEGSKTDGTVEFANLPPPSQASDGLPFGALFVLVDPSGAHGSRRRFAKVARAQSGVAQSAERRPVKAMVVGSSPTPGASMRACSSVVRAGDS